MVDLCAMRRRQTLQPSECTTLTSPDTDANTREWAFDFALARLCSIWMRVPASSFNAALRLVGRSGRRGGWASRVMKKHERITEEMALLLLGSKSAHGTSAAIFLSNTF